MYNNVVGRNQNMVQIMYKDKNAVFPAAKHYKPISTAHL